jgi:hypothetical protein
MHIKVHHRQVAKLIHVLERTPSRIPDDSHIDTGMPRTNRQQRNIPVVLKDLADSDIFKGIALGSTNSAGW